MKLKQFLLACLLSLGVVGVMQQVSSVEKVRAEEEDEIYCTVTFGPDTNSQKINTYSNSWSVTVDDDVFEVKNANNNNNGWAFIKMGVKGSASVGHVATTTAIPEAISKVVVTIDAITVTNINSLKLYVADDKDFTNASEVNIDKSKGAKEAVIENPAKNKFYKFEADCKSGLSNGLVTISKLEFYYKNLNLSLEEDFQANCSVEGQLAFDFNTSVSLCDVDANFTPSDLKFDNGTYKERTGTIPNTTVNITTDVCIDTLKFQTGKTKGCSMYNSTAFEGNINSIKFKLESKVSVTVKVYAAENDVVDAEGDEVGSINCNSSLTPSIDFPTGSNYKYFYIDLNTSTSIRIESVTVNYVGKSHSYSNFANMAMKFKTSFDFGENVKGTDYTEAGMLLVHDGATADFSGDNATATELDEEYVVCTQTDYSKDYVVALTDIAEDNYVDDILVVPYILVDEVYYFGVAKTYSVVDMVDKYKTSDATITLSDDSVVNVSDIAAALDASI